MSEILEALEACFRRALDDGPEARAALEAGLRHANWRVRMAAAVALGDRGDAAAVPALLRALEAEDLEPVYTQPENMVALHAGSNEPFTLALPAGTPEQTLECWRRRGRLRQSLCLALGQLGKASVAALPLLHRYAVDAGQDYMVRAAACLALGRIGDPASLPVLEQAVHDSEWCTQTEARRSLAAVRNAREL
jgi:HEAT repeat protein